MTYALVMIVKNESEKIRDCLIAASKYCDVATIIDTGSTDNTVEICEEIFPGSVSHMEWVDFGTCRTAAIEKARGTADWLLTLDADMVVEIDDDFVPDPSIDAYRLRMKGSAVEWWLPLLVRGDLDWKYEGAIHEFKYIPGYKYVSQDTDKVRVNFTTTTSYEKNLQRADILVHELEKNPDNPRNVFYLASTYLDLDMVEEAKEIFDKRASMDGDPEERWVASFRSAMLETEWKDRLFALLKVWHNRPHRPEPLYALVQGLNEKQQYFAAYALAPTKFPPNPDSSFIHPFIMDWGMKFEKSVAAYHVGRLEEFKRLSNELLDNPNIPPSVRRKIVENLSEIE